LGNKDLWFTFGKACRCYFGFIGEVNEKATSSTGFSFYSIKAF
jgi:hypothetical protein